MLRKKDGTADKRSTPLSVRLARARANRYKVIHRSHLFLLWAINASGCEAHIEPITGRDTGFWKGVLCVHSPVGQLAFMLTEDDLADFKHLKKHERSHWEGHSAEVNMERLRQLAYNTPKPNMREPVTAKSDRGRILKRHGLGQNIARHVASQALGKPLPKGACVHHVNGDPADNRPENLVICQDQDYHTLLHQNTKLRQERIDRENA